MVLTKTLLTVETTASLYIGPEISFLQWNKNNARCLSVNRHLKYLIKYIRQIINLIRLKENPIEIYVKKDRFSLFCVALRANIEKKLGALYPFLNQFSFSVFISMIINVL